ncbi:MAG: VUT family protein [Cytophagales bacterium]|nr:MAG: VUT family protein [Cytophagales bacterium]TAF59631.1 MAG: VUT family protein [Cytophagales bacterium]
MSQSSIPIINQTPSDAVTGKTQRNIDKENSRKNTLFVVLTGIFLTNALLAEIIGTKIFSLESALGVPAAGIKLWADHALNFDLTCGVVLWPVVFITTDIINEYYGKSGVRRISLLTVFFISYVFMMIWVITELPPADFWVDLHKPTNINEAFNSIFLQSLGIIIGSITAFLIGQALDVIAFQWLRKFTGSKNIWLRATGSTLFSQLIDSFVVLGIAFYLFGEPRWELSQLLSVGVVNYIYKFSVAICLTPVLYGAHYLIDHYLGKENAERMIEEASQSSFVSS